MRTTNDKIVKAVHEQVQDLFAGFFVWFTLLHRACLVCGIVAAFSISVECCLVEHFECQNIISTLG